MNQMNRIAAALLAIVFASFLAACGQQNGQAGSYCASNAECLQGNTCNILKMICESNGGGQQPADSCSADTDCKNGSHCNKAAQKCEQNGNPQPDGGGGTQLKPNNTACGADAECISGFCDPTNPRTCQNRPNQGGPTKTYTIEFVGVPAGSSPSQRFCDGRPYQVANLAANGGFRNWPNGDDKWSSFGNDVYRLPTAYASSATLNQSDALRFQCRDVNLVDGKVVETYGCDSSRGIVPIVKLNGRTIGLVLVPNLNGGMNCQTTE
jgi:hypothetical protein